MNTVNRNFGVVNQAENITVISCDPRIEAPKISASQGQELKELVNRILALQPHHSPVPSYKVWDKLNDHCNAVPLANGARYKNILADDFYKAKAFLLEWQLDQQSQRKHKLPKLKKWWFW
ncbi:hypothetical protein [Agarivorans sp. QJM3NY_25]|uniref:hypothetical protein n=1 Tax=Agarivorans sp. QJM3NY_25 TaxID=3421430 RepID=UPI003D7DAD9C